MAKWQLTPQRKINIRGENEILIDLHFHLGRQKSLTRTINRLAEAIDVIALTERGSRFSNEFEYDFNSFVDQLHDEKAVFQQFDSGYITVATKSGTLTILKAQEVFTKEGFDVVIVGSPVHVNDDVPVHSIATEFDQSLLILSTPFQVPNRLRTRRADDAQTAEIASSMHCLEVHNQSVFFNTTNCKARNLSRKLKLRGISVSDQHLYSQASYPISLSGVIISKPKDDDKYFDCIRESIISGSFRNYCVYSPFSILEFLSLAPRQIVSLFRGSSG